MTLVVKNSPVDAGASGDAGSIPGSGRLSGGGNSTHSSILAWRIIQTEDPAGCSPWGHKESDTTEHLSTLTHMLESGNTFKE